MTKETASMADQPSDSTDDEPKGLGEEELRKLLAREIEDAETNDDADLTLQRTKALEYYDGVLNDLVAEEGRSSVVSTDVRDVVGWMMPSIMQIYTASDRMALAEPVGDDDEAWANEATIGLNHLFMKDNPGYRILRDATWDALVLKNAIIKAYWDDTPEYAVSFHSGLTADALTLLIKDEKVEVLQHSSRMEMVWQVTDPTVPDQAVEVPVEMHEVKIKRLKSEGRIVVECIPPEDYLQDADAVFTPLARFRAHRARKTRSDLIAMGFDPDVVKDLSVSIERTTDDEKRAREDRSYDRSDSADRSMEEVDLYECYVRVDVDGDGIAETVRAFYAGSKDGGKVLDWEIWEEEGPFYDIPCDPIPHRWDGRSVADDTIDVQKTKTALLRQFMDNVYAANNPQRFATGKITNPEQLFSPTFGSTIFGETNATLTNVSVPMVAGPALQAIAYQDETSQRRTGVSRQSMALDPETLQSQSATANQNAKDASHSQVEQVARDMAELGWKPVFRALLRLLIKHQNKPRTIRMQGKAVTIDPRHWNADMDVTINVGLGTGSRDRDMAHLSRVLQTQIMLADRFMGTGAVEDAVDMLPKILSTMVKMAESAGLRNPSDYYPEYAEDKVLALKKLAADRAQQPDPNAAKAMADEQGKQAQAQRDHEYRMAKLAADEKANLAKINADLSARQYQVDQEIALKERQLVTEMNLKLRGIAGLGALSASEVHVGGTAG